jgi:hypothetical protein
MSWGIKTAGQMGMCALTSLPKEKRLAMMLEDIKRALS